MAGPNNGNIVVPVGVQLELKNVQEIINSLQKTMGQVKPDTKGYSVIVRELSNAEKRADSLISKLKQGFTTNTGIQNFTKGFEDLVALVDAINGKVADINFDNLTLTPEQQAQMKTFADAIEAAKNAYRDFESDKIKQAVTSSKELKQTFDDLKLNVDTTTLDNAINTIETKVANLQKDIDKDTKRAERQEATVALRQSEIDELKKLKAIFKSKDLSKDFGDFFKASGDFKSGGKQAFINLLEKLGLDSNTIDKVKKTAGKQIKSIQEEIEKAIDTATKKKGTSRDNARDAANKIRADIATNVKVQKELENSQSKLQDIQQSQDLTKAKEQETIEIKKHIEAREEYKKVVEQGIKGDAGVDAAESLSEALNHVRESSGSAAVELDKLNQKTQTIERIKHSVAAWMGFNQVLRLSRTAIRNMIKDIRDLDKVMTEIAVVTNMSQSDLWAQMGQYQSIAKQYGVATTGVYQVSQIYYQQGLQTADVMALTNETLKMAKIAGLDYSKAADYMTVAIRGFKMEMTDATKVVDVYSNLAAKSAVDTTELATAMSKTASSAAAVGSSFENTSAMIAMMVETTRESAENIGSALKSIISRYGEMKEDPTKLIDSEGEALSLNKVDKALQSVGISLQDANHQFRDFDDVILELSSKWDDLDKNSQRYIATIMAGNRQQSRFLALVSDYDRLAELYDEAANSEDAALVQTLKTMDSLETKIQNVKNAFQGFYANLGLESVFKGVLDAVTNIINRLNTMPKVFNKIPLAAIGMVANIVNVIKTLGITLITVTTSHWQKISDIIKNNLIKGYKEGTDAGTNYQKQKSEEAAGQVSGNAKGQFSTGRKVALGIGQGLSLLGAAGSTFALTMTKADPAIRGLTQATSGLTSGIGALVSSMAMVPGTGGIILGLISAITSSLPGIVSGIDDITHAEARRIEQQKEVVKQAKQDALIAKQEANNLNNAITKLEKLTEARFDSNEAYQEWIDYKNQLVDQYPELLSLYDAEGNAVINTAEAYRYLAEKRREAAAAEKQAKIDNLELRKQESEQINNILNKPYINLSGGDELGKGLKNLSNLSYYGNDLQRGKLYTAQFNRGQIQLTQEDFNKIFSYEGDYFYDTYDENDNRVKDLDSSALKINLNNIDEMLSSNNHELQQVYGDLVYENYIKPLSESSAMAETEFGAENIKKEIERISNETINGKKKTDEQIEQDVFKYYMRLGKKIVGKAEDLVKINEELAQVEADLAEINNSFEDTLYKTDSNDYATLVKIGSSSLMKQINQNYMQPYKQQLTNGEITEDEYKAHQEEFANLLIQQYIATGEKTWSEIESLLSHTEKYTSKANLLTDIANLFGGEIPNTIIKGINDSVNNAWKLTNEDLQKSFKNNIRGSKKTNQQINQSAWKMETIGNGVGNTEIAAQYLNNINKQWSDLVTNQKNEAVATQNAKFLADTYVNIGSMSEEVNSAMAGILTNATLDTREGLQTAIDQIEQYQADNTLEDKDKEKLDKILEQLREHKDNLLLNLNTEIQTYVNGLSDAIKQVSQNYSKNLSGFDELKDANEILDKINAGKTSDKQLDFTEVFTFDKTLGKYVFTVQGIVEANNAVMEDLNSQYEDVNKKLIQEKSILSTLNTVSQKQNFNKEAIIGELRKVSTSQDKTISDGTKAYFEKIAEEFEKSGKTWNEFYLEKQKELENLEDISEEEHQAALQMMVEAQKTSALKSLDFSGIVKGTKSFEETRQTLYNYLTAGMSEGDLAAQKDQIETETKEIYDDLTKGGEIAAEKYKALLGDMMDPTVYNDLFNAPSEAAKSLLDALNNSLGKGTIQLNQAQQKLLNTTETSISASELSKSYDNLIAEINKGLENNTISLQEANTAIASHQTTDAEKNVKYADAISSFIANGNFTTEAMGQLASSLNTTLKSDFNIEGLKQFINTSESGDKYISDIYGFLGYLQTAFTKLLPINDIKDSLDLADKSKITEAAIKAENNIIESIASEINNIKSTGLNKKINLTYLTNKLGSDKLGNIFGEAYQNGILTVTNEVKVRMYSSLKSLKNELKAQEQDTSELDKTLLEYVNSAISEVSEFTGSIVVSDNTAQLLADALPSFKTELQQTGKITLSSIENFARAANWIYNEVNNQYQQGLTNLTQLNSSYANIVKASLAKQSAGFNILSNATNIDLSSLQDFANIYNIQLSKFIDKQGSITKEAEATGLTSLGNGKYQISNWKAFVAALGNTANELSAEYIDAYISWLQSDINVAPNAKEALMTSLIPNMEKLSYAQIGQIAKTFKMTVDDVLLLVENNGDNTFNGAALLNTLQFDKNNEDFARALSTQMQTVSSNMTSAMIAFVEAGADGKRTDLDYTTFRNAIADYEKAMKALGKNVIIDISAIEYTLKQGGEQAVIAAQKIAKISGQELSAQEIESLYRSAIVKFTDAIDKVVAKPGEIVDKTTADLISQNGGKVNQLGTTGQYVVESVANLYEAYNDLLLKLKATGEATLADINKVAALALENRDGEQQVIDALGDAAGMTFTRFGEILADAGIELTEDMINNLEAANIIKLMGGNKMQIIDFNAFADLMHWDANSEEYVSAFKTYNDSLIDLNRKAEQNIFNEAKNVASAKGGDWINLTQLMSKLQEGFRYEGSEKISLGDSLETSIQKFDAKIEEGILKLGDSANIPAIIQEIAQAAAESGGLLSSELAELADAVADAIKGYADLISGAISGSLSNVQAEQLQDWASTNGIGKLNFTETADGLKVATDQAFELVAALRQVDSMQGKLTFDNLVDSLSADKGGRFENISKTTAEIAQTEEKLKTIQTAIENVEKNSVGNNEETLKNLKSQKSELQDQLNLYRQIQQYQSIDPSQYNFMDRDIPEVMQGPVNYWNSVGKAFEAMNESSKTGTMEIQDFYNIVNEMENLANTSNQVFDLAGYKIGGSASQAAQLIQDGMSKLTNIDGKGVKVNLNNLGVDFAAGADGAKKDFQTGIKSLAESQVAMLDAAIKVLEVVVAMEQLKDLDVAGEDNTLDLSDLFKIDIETGKATDWDEDFRTASEKILALAEEDNDLKDALEKVKVNNTSLGDMFAAAKDSYEIVNGQIEELGMSVDKYQTVMDAFYQAMLNGDYNLDTIQDSVWEILNKTLPDGTTIEIGNRTVVISGGTSLQIDWENEDTQNALKLFEGDLEDKKDALKEAFIAYSNKTATHEQITAILTYKGKIKINIETGEVTIGNNTYPDLDSDEAQLAIAEEALKDAGADKINDDGKIEGKGDEKVVTISSTMKVGEQEIKIEYNNGKITYTDGVNSADSWEELIHKQFLAEQKLANENGSSGWSSEEEFVKVRYGLKVAAELFPDNVSIKNEENFKNRTQEQVNKLASALVSGDKDEVVEAAKTIGINIDVEGELTAEQRQQIAEIAGITSETKALNVALSVTGDKIDLIERLLKGEDLIAKIDADIDAATSKVNEIIKAIEEEKKKPVDLDTKKANSTLSTLENAIQATVNKYADIYINYTQQYKDALADITKDVDKTVNIKTKGTVNTGSGPKAGNVALATGTGNAYSAGNTLMGELGPELVVSHGRYFVVGQNGPEMVDLADDAIVFNHLQTQQLLKHGKTSSRATPITNERKATSLATGNAGPAMASASDALATLKQLRSMWQSLLNASLRDLGAMGGSGGGGGGGGGGNNDTTGVVKDVERWYNWLKKIEETQNKINILTKKYTLLEKQNATETQKLANLTKQYENLADNKSTKEQLAAEQTKYRKNLLKQVNGKEKGSYNLLSAFYSANEKTGKLTLKDDKAFEKYIGKKKAKKLKNEGIKLTRREYYTEEEAEEYNKNNQVKVKAGDYKGKAKNKDTIKAKNGLELIDQLQKKDNYGNLIYSAEDQYNILANLLGKKKFEKYVAKDTSGKELESWEEKVEYFFTQIESGKGEIEDLNQSIQEQTESALDDAIAMQEINEQIRELYTPTAGITEGFEEWYNELKKIESITNNLTKLSKQLDILENDRIANGEEIYKNLVEQTKQNNERIKQEEDLIEKRKAERNNLLEGELNFLKPFVDLNTEKGIATFKEQSLEEILGKDFNSEITYKKSGVAKTNKQGYFVDTKGRYYDDKGILRNKNGEKAKKGVEFGEQATTKEKNATFNFSDYKDLNALIKELKSKNENGSFKYDSSETFQILSQVPEFAEMMKYDEQGNKVYQDLASMSKEEKQEAAQLVVSKLQKGIDSLNDNEKAIFDGEMNIYDAQAANLDLQRKLTETRRSLEDKVMDAIIDLRQAIIDEAQKERDAYSKAANKMVDGLNNQLKKEQEMYDKNKDDKEIETLQRQIGILQRSGGSASEIQKLQNDLADKQKDAYFKERQSEIDVIKEASDKQLEKMDQQIELMNASLEIERQNGLLWPQVIQAITNGTAVDLIGKNRKLNSESAERRDEEITGAQEEAETVEAQQKDQKQAQKVNEAIQTLPESISVNDKQTVADIRKDYDDIQDKTLISDENTQKLINAEKQIQNQEIVDDLTQKINALPETITLSNKEAVDTAQNIYNKMTDEQKALIQVDVASKLEKATTAIKNASANQAAADGVTNELNKLYPKYGFDKPAVVDAALAAWNALTKEQQALVGKEPKEKLDTAVKVKELTEKYKTNVKKEQENAIKNKELETLKLNNDLKNAKTAKEKENIQNQLSKLDGNLLSKLQAELNKKYNSFKKNLEKLGVLKKNLPKQLILNSFPKTPVIPQFAQGGTIDFTGLAMVHGSKTKPETIFNDEQTKMLKEILFKNNSLISNLQAAVFNPNSEAMNSYNSSYNENDSSIQINEVNMSVNVPSISNDYDARRAGQMALDEMVRVARKSGNRAVSRR